MDESGTTISLLVPSLISEAPAVVEMSLAEGGNGLHGVSLIAPGLRVEGTEVVCTEDILGTWCAIGLLCVEGECWLQGARRGEDEQIHVKALPGGTVPLARTNGIVGSGPGAGLVSVNRLCAFGDGVACFDGDDWSIEVPGDEHPELKAAAVLGEWSDLSSVVVVGDGGTILVEGPDSWERIESGTEADLLTIAAAGDFFVAGGEEVLIFAVGGHLMLCDLDLSFQPLLSHAAFLPMASGDRRDAVLWGSDGRAIKYGFLGEETTACEVMPPLPSPPKGIGEIGSMDDRPIPVVTSSQLYGMMDH